MGLWGYAMASRVAVNPKRCVGCLACQLACSLKNYGFFSPSKAMIRVSRVEGGMRVEYSEDCKGCLECVKWCLYGALTVRGGGGG